MLGAKTGVVLVFCAVAVILVVAYGTGIFTTTTSGFTVDVYDPTKAYNGTTLFADMHDPKSPRIVEVDMWGNVVWEYVLPSDLKDYTNPGFDVELLPDNHVLFVAPRKGVYEIDRSGNIVWSYLDSKVSHDADRLPNGNTLVVWGGGDSEGDAQVKEVNENGEIVWSWRARDSYLERYPPEQYSLQGWTHANAAQRLSNGDTMVSLRNFGLTAIVSENGTVVKEFDWSPFGETTHPHDPEIFENRGSIFVCLQRDSPYAVVEAGLENKETLWTYSATDLRTTRDGDLLPNGNVLITTVDTGGTADEVSMDDDYSTLIEVTPSGEIVWRLSVNVPVGKNPGWFYKAERIGPSTS